MKLGGPAAWGKGHGLQRWADMGVESARLCDVGPLLEIITSRGQQWLSCLCEQRGSH